MAHIDPRLLEVVRCMGRIERPVPAARNPCPALLWYVGALVLLDLEFHTWAVQKYGGVQRHIA